jgi:8-oxo-dGTP diphosphatase
LKKKNSIHVLSRGVILDAGHILLCKTTSLANNFYYVPGGHVNHEESVYDTVIRELKEESGALCQVKRFLGCLEFKFEPEYKDACHTHEYNFIFELESKYLKMKNPIPQLETKLTLHWIALSELCTIYLNPPPLKKLIPLWLNSNTDNAFKSMYES